MSDEVRILFFDVDGTIIHHEPGGDVGETVATGRPSEGVARAFRELRDRGHMPFICTGRPLSLIAESLLALEPTGIISSAGACVSVGEKILFDRVIDAAVIDRLLEIAERSGHGVLLEGTDGDVVYTPANAVYANGGGIPVVRTREELRVQTTMRFSKFVLEAADRDAVISCDPAFFDAQFDGFDLGLGISEYTMKGVDKGFGVKHALECLEHGVAGTIAFGDSENDLPMAGAVETFVAMGNAMPAVKARAAYVTGPVQDDGVVSALEHFGLI